MSTDADRFREEAIAAEQEQDWDLWMARSLARLWEEAGREGPWSDAAPDGEKTSSEDEADGDASAALYFGSALSYNRDTLLL